MLDYPIEFFKTLYGPTQPLWVKVWVSWMILVNNLSVVFMKKKLGKVTFIAWTATGAVMMFFYAYFGFTRILGMAHIITWTPLLIFLLKNKNEPREPIQYNIWYWALISTISISLVFDVADVIRYFN